jgi:SAM-dependent methyltransferase
MARRVYVKVVPAAIRRSPVVQRLKGRVLGHEAMYDADYYAEGVEPAARRSAGAISQSIVDTFGPVRLLDVGCGTGALLEALRDRGCTVHGLEYSDAGLEFCRRRQLDVTKFDLEHDVLDLPGSFDVVSSMEVAEHLPARVADRYVDLIATATKAVVFTAAGPGQEGADHINLQPPSYWLEKFTRRGFTHDEPTTTAWQRAWTADGNVEAWYITNLMVLRRP